MRGRERRTARWPVCAVVLLALSAGTPTLAAPIRGILIHHVGDAPAPLGFTFDQETGEGVLTVDIESFTLLLTREGEEDTEFIVDASFHMEATGMTDLSEAPLAAGSFDSVVFELWDHSGEEPVLLLRGRRESGADLSYSETPALDVMSILSEPVLIEDGLLAPDFDSHTILFGQAIRIDPGTESFDRLDTDHSGSITLELVPIPEAGSAALWGIVAAWSWRRRSARRTQACPRISEEKR